MSQTIDVQNITDRSLAAFSTSWVTYIPGCSLLWSPWWNDAVKVGITVALCGSVVSGVSLSDGYVLKSVLGKLQHAESPPVSRAVTGHMVLF